MQKRSSETLTVNNSPLSIWHHDQSDAVRDILIESSILNKDGVVHHLVFIPLVTSVVSEQLVFDGCALLLESVNNAIRDCIKTSTGSNVQVSCMSKFLSHDEVMNITAMSIKKLLNESASVDDSIRYLGVPNRPIASFSYFVGVYCHAQTESVSVDQYLLRHKLKSMVQFAQNSTSVEFDVLELGDFSEAIVGTTVACIRDLKNHAKNFEIEEGLLGPIQVELPEQKLIVLSGHFGKAQLRISPYLMGSAGIEKILEASFEGCQYSEARTIN